MWDCKGFTLLKCGKTDGLSRVLIGTSKPVCAVRPEQGQSDAHRPTREINHRPRGSSLTPSSLLASPGKAEHKQVQTTQAVYCKTSHITQWAYQESKAQQPARARTTHPPLPAYLPKVPVHCESAQAAICPGPSFCTTADTKPSSLLQMSTGMTALPPLVLLPLASRPFMSLSVLHGRPRCQASSTQLPSSQDTMHSSVCRQRHLHGKGSELNPLLIVSETPGQADTVC